MEGPGRTNRRDLFAGIILLAFAAIWTVAVYTTVPTSNYGVGPRAFPLYLGVALMVLSAFMIAGSLRAPPPGEPPSPDELDAGDPEVMTASAGLRFRILLVVCSTIAVYGYLMQKIGFVLATLLTVVVTLLLVLRERRPLVVAGMALGLTVGSWLAFGKVLGAYIPRGTWISLF